MGESVSLEYIIVLARMRAFIRQRKWNSAYAAWDRLTKIAPELKA